MNADQETYLRNRVRVLESRVAELESERTALSRALASMTAERDELAFRLGIDDE